MIYVYSPDLTKRYEIAHAESLQMNVLYNGIGKMSLVLPIDDYNISVIQQNSILYSTIFDVAFIIKAIKYDPDKSQLTANGYTTNWILNRRVVAVKTVIGTIETGVYTAISNNLRGLSNITTASIKGLTSQSDAELYGGQLLDEIIKVLGTASMGHRMKWDTESKSHIFEVYMGNDLTDGLHSAIFSPERGTATGLIINDDDSLFANVVYVSGTLSSDEHIYEVYGTASGDESTEFWLDSSESQDEDEAEADFRTKLRTSGEEKAAELVRRKSFKVNIDVSEFGVMYNLGDIVLCTSSKFNQHFSARITGVTYKMDKNGTAVSLTLGEPLITAIGELKLRGY